MIQDVLGNLLKNLQVQRDRLALYVTSGGCDSYDDYRFHTGLLEGLQVAGDLIAKESEAIEIGQLSPTHTRTS
ncbi:hypothetical protein Bealeia2_01951 (plasmid) [Candidatus Bealeia paramacronuclearis]|uniref:hypothetical protein n=1 Tax=Candidatus Bealeia paramacronuclearis TaxID=1921001 RepID=UPI002BEDCBA0|nr:hypothetical protein [Candidatus Bealeia paramacronuclearis]